MAQLLSEKTVSESSQNSEACGVVTEPRAVATGSSIIYHLPIANCQLPIANCHLPFAICRASISCYLPMTNEKCQISNDK